MTSATNFCTTARVLTGTSTLHYCKTQRPSLFFIMRGVQHSRYILDETMGDHAECDSAVVNTTVCHLILVAKAGAT